jgi:LCP family protein required for cell wall assembly
MKISYRVYRIIAKFILAIAALVFIGVVVFVGLQIYGKRNLYNKSNSTGPNLDQAVISTETETATDTENMTAQAQNDDDWQEGDIRYKGVHYRYNSDILTFLILGIDKMDVVKRVKNGIDGGQSDAIFLLVLNPHSKEVSIISIPRDTMTEIAVYAKDGSYIGTNTGQITLQHGYGDGAETSCERSEEAVSKLFYNLPIHGYCAINMGAIPMINDIVGGVEVTALEDVINSDIKKDQTILLKGMNAYYYVHNRDTNKAESAVGRLERQKQYITAYMKLASQTIKEDITFPLTLYNTISKYMVTDITVDEISYLATQASGYSFDSDRLYTLSGEVVKDNKFEEFYVDETALYELILQVFYEEVQ